MSYLNHIDWDAVDHRGFLQEDEVWDAIAEAEGLEYSEIADGDILDWL
jgi:hypothetical protein